MIIYGSKEEEVVVSEGFEVRLATDPKCVTELHHAYVSFHVLDDGSHEIEFVTFEDEDGNEVIVLDSQDHDLIMDEVKEEIERIADWLYEDWVNQGGPILQERELEDGKIIDYTVQSLSDSVWRRRRAGSFH